jgi:O-antigen/teichoic acid export membrane protein
MPRAKTLCRTVLEGAGLITLASLLGRLLAVLSAPVLTNLLGPGPYGVAALLATPVSLGSILGLAGVDHSYARYYFDGSREDRFAVERFCWRVALGLTAGVTLAVCLAWYAVSHYLNLSPSLTLMVGIGISVGSLHTMAVTRRRLLGSYGRIALSMGSASSLAVALAIVLAYVWRRDEWTLLVSAALANAVAIAIAGLPPAATVSTPSHLSPARRRDVLRLGFAGSAIGPLYWLMNSTDRWMLSLWSGHESLGVYAFSQSVGTVGLILNSAITLTWFPEMTRVYDADPSTAPKAIGEMWARLVGLLLIAGLFVSAVGGEAIRFLAAPSFHAGASLVPWFAAGVVCYGVAGLANTGLLLRKRLAPAAAWWLVGAIVNAGLNATLVSRHGPLGAAMAGCGGYLVIAIGIAATAQVSFRLLVPWCRLLATAGLACLAGTAIAAVPAGNALTILALKLTIALSCASVIVWILAPGWMSSTSTASFLRKLSGTRASES